MQPLEIDGIFLYSQCNALGELPAHPFGLSETSSRATHLLALMMGGIKIAHSNDPIIQRRNYMIIGAPPASPFASQNLERSFSDLREEKNNKLYFRNSKRAICEYLKSQRSNHNLFSPLFNELARAFINANKNNGLSAFVHIYRAFESSSYTFPLFYCRYEKQYLKAYNLLKDFFKEGELDFCARFFKHLVAQDSLNQLPIEIKFPGVHASDFASLMANSISWTEKGAGQTISRSSDSSVTINFEHCFDLIIKLRNGYFHHLSGSSSSISSFQIKNADEFFSPINDLALQVFGFIYGKIIRTHL